MTEIMVQFDIVATNNLWRTPKILLNPDVKEFLDRYRATFEYLLAGVYTPYTEQWQVLFTFRNRADAIAFKLTFC